MFPSQFFEINKTSVRRPNNILLRNRYKEHPPIEMVDIPRGSSSIRQSTSEKRAESPGKLQPGITSTSGSKKISSSVQLSRPFLTKNQIRIAQNRTIANKTVYEQRRNQVFNFLMKICVSLKFPIRTLETAMLYYQKYFLYNKFDISVYYDIAVTAMFIASKNEDNIKKLRDIISVANQTRNLMLTNEQLESYRKKILSLEFRLLETISFDFRTFHVEESLVKIAKTLKIPEKIAYLAWLIAFDSYQTEVGLKLLPHTIAIASINLATKVEDYELKITSDIYYTTQDAVNEAMLDLLDLYINSYNYSGLAQFYPNLQTKFVDIRIPLTNAKVMKDQDESQVEADEYFNERDYTVAERRYMLGNQKKRLYNEIKN